MPFNFRPLLWGLCFSASAGAAQAQDCNMQLDILSKQTEREAIQSARLDVMLCLAQLYHRTEKARPFAPDIPASSYFKLSLGDPVTLTAHSGSQVTAGTAIAAGAQGTGFAGGAFNDGANTYACAQQYRNVARIGMAQLAPTLVTPGAPQIILKAVPNLNSQQLKFAQGAGPKVNQVLSAHVWKPEYRASDLGLQEITRSALASGKFDGFVNAEVVRTNPCDTAPGSAATNPVRVMIETDLIASPKN